MTKTAATTRAAKTVGEAIRTAREARGWSKSELARHLGTSYRQVHRWETGDAAPGAPLMSGLSTTLGLDLKALIALVASAAPASPEWKRFVESARGLTTEEMTAVRMTYLGDAPTAEDYADALAMHRRRAKRQAARS